MESEEATNLAKLRALFPDYHSAFKDLVLDHADEDHNVDNDDKDGATADAQEDEVDARIKALGHMSDKQLSLVVARHCRIFLSLSDRRRRQVQRLLAPAASRPGQGSTTTGAERQSLRSCSDAERVVAFGDSYRASVLLAGPTSRLPACVVLTAPTSHEFVLDGDFVVREASSIIHMEQAFAASHLMALANAARLCKSGKSLLDDAVDCDGAIVTAPKRKATKGLKAPSRSAQGWVGEGAVGRNLSLVDPVVNFHLDADVGETRLADAPLAAVLRRVAGLLEEFPGHGVLIQVCPL